MTKSELIVVLLNAFVGTRGALAMRRRRLQQMSVAGLKREMLLRGLAEYQEPDDDDYAAAESCFDFPASMLGLLTAGDRLYPD